MGLQIGFYIVFEICLYRKIWVSNIGFDLVVFFDYTEKYGFHFKYRF